MVEKTNHFLSLKQVTIRDPFFSPVQNTVIHTMIPYQEKVLHDEIPDIRPSHVIRNYRIAAGEIEGTYYGRVFQDSDLAKWLEAVAYSLTVQPDAELEARADEIIDLIGQVQKPDGYLDTYFIVAEPEMRWKDLGDCHEMYCAGHMTEAAVAYYEATGKTKLLDICCRLCDHIDRRFGDEEGKVPGIPGHEEIELALMRLYRVTGEDRYRKLASYFIDKRGHDPDFFKKEADARGGDPNSYINRQLITYAQNHAPVREQDTAEGHAVRCMYLYTGAADIAAANQDEALMEACRKVWDNMTKRRMYITGGIGATHQGESFSTDYDLPNDSAYAETCAAVGVCFFARQMLEADPDRRYADVMERALYNGVLSGMQLDGKKFFYINQLEADPDACSTAYAYGSEEYTPERIGWYDCACCPPNLARLVTSIGSYTWSCGENTIYSHLFLGGSADFDFAGGGIVKLEGNYPWDGTLTYTVSPKNPNATFTLAIRHPGWCRSMTVTVNGENVSESTVNEKGYWELSRAWNPGDTVICRMDLPVRRIYANPLVRADAGCVALMRGPIVYAFEGIDNGEDLSALRIPRDAAIEALPFNADLLGGVVALKIAGRRLKPMDDLYSDYPPEEEEAVLQAIPYYAWCNRGRTHMKIWMQE